MIILLEKINNIVWGPATVFIILFCGIYFSVFSGFFQIKNLKRSIMTVLIRKNKSTDRSSFRALSAALAGTIGTGNIAGVATSIALGGPGAIFWMIVSGFFGMMVKFAEVVLAVKFRNKTKGGYIGGPMYYIEKGLGLKRLGTLYAILLALSAFGIGNMVQANSVSGALYNTFNISKNSSGIIITTICFAAIIGGSKKIMNITEIIVPFMAVFYLIGTIICLIVNFKFIPSTIIIILNSAFSEKSFISGFGGFVVSRAVKYGISRGVFTNEAGMGSSSVAHATGTEISPAEQGLWGIFEVFFDTVIMCSLTALVILTADGGTTFQTGKSGIDLTLSSFSSVLGMYGSLFVSISILFFSIATIFGWCIYGEKAIHYLSGDSKTALNIYKLLYILAIYPGSVLSLDSVWIISDILNGLLIFPNIAALFMLRKHVFNEIKQFNRLL